MPQSIIHAQNKKSDLFLSPAMFTVIGICLAMIVASFVVKIYVSSFVIFVSLIIILYYYSQPPKEIEITINDSGISIDQQLINWSQVISWDTLEFENYTEICLLTNRISSTYATFYVNNGNRRTLEILSSAMEYYKITHQVNLATDNNLQNLFRILGLR